MSTGATVPGVRNFDTGREGIAVVGLGFIGLPLALSYAMRGCRVVGIDIDTDRVAAINAGESELVEDYRGRSLREILREQLEAGRFFATTDYAEAAEQCSRYVVTVGMPLRGERVDPEPLIAACRTLGRLLRRGDLVLVRSTVIPGSTEEWLRPALEAGGLQAGTDFHLAYASERIAEGRAFEEFATIPVILGGIDEASIEAAVGLIGRINDQPVRIAPIRVIETSKLVENIFRDVNIAIAQQVARFAEAFGIDTFSLIELANTHPRVELLTPGVGVGGYCLPLAARYLAARAERLGLSLPLFETARQLNDEAPAATLRLLERGLARQGKTLAGSRLAILGLAMKDGSSDDRNSPAIVFGDLAQRAGARVRAYDPLVRDARPYQVSRVEEAFAGADALAYLVHQPGFEAIDWPRQIARMAPAPVILDAKNRLHHLAGPGPGHPAGRGRGQDGAPLYLTI